MDGSGISLFEPERRHPVVEVGLSGGPHGDGLRRSPRAPEVARELLEGDAEAGRGLAGPPRLAARRTSSWSTRRAARFSRTRMSFARSQAMPPTRADVAGSCTSQRSGRGTTLSLGEATSALARNRSATCSGSVVGTFRTGRCWRTPDTGPSPTRVTPARTRRCRGGRGRGGRRRPRAFQVRSRRCDR